MAPKDKLQNALKEDFSINKNISQVLSYKECERLLELLYSEPSAAKLVSSYAEKNFSLGHNNAVHGRARSQTEKKFAALKSEYLQLENFIASIEQDKTDLESKKKFLEEEQKKLEAEIQDLSSKNQLLASQIQNLSTENNALTAVNTQLKQDNKDLKNIVDQIRLRLARDTKMLLQYEDSEIRKALIRLFRWTLG